MDDFKPTKKDGNRETDNSNVKPTTVVESGCVDISETVCNASINKETVVLDAILPIKIKKKGKAESVTTYAFYDAGNSGCFVTENIRRWLKKALRQFFNLEECTVIAELKPPF